jgi:rare lipoprotein A
MKYRRRVFHAVGTILLFVVCVMGEVRSVSAYATAMRIPGVATFCGVEQPSCIEKSLYASGNSLVAKERAKKVLDRGIASWYGEKFHGRPTANGESFDKDALTVAHRTISLGTLVRVVNVWTGVSVVVRVNDRGPFVEGRVVDLSEAAARKLGLIKSGTGMVEITAL